MNSIKNKASCVLIISLILYFAAAPVHAGMGKRSLFAENIILFDGDYLPGSNNLTAEDQKGSMYVKPRVSSEKIALEVLTGIAGNVALGLSLGILGNSFPDRSESLIGGGAILGFYTGSLCGSALGVYLVGNSGNARGNFGMALLGSFLGEIASLGILFSIQSNTSGFEGLVGLLSMAILPPVGATILFNSSLRYRSLLIGNGLLNLDKDKLTLGIPDIQIRPLPIYGKNMKAGFQFKINVLSMVL